MTARQRAEDLLAFYFRAAWEAAGLEFTGDNLAEVRSIADALIDAAREEPRDRFDSVGHLGPCGPDCPCADMERQAAAELEAAVPDPAAILAAILGVLDAFDWETDDRQYALEKIDRIARGGAPC